jgi:hypothetical protein
MLSSLAKHYLVIRDLHIDASTCSASAYNIPGKYDCSWNNMFLSTGNLSGNQFGT